MKKILTFFLLLTCLLGYSQNPCSETFLQDDFGGYQFYEEIVEILDLAKEKNIKKVEFNLKEYQNLNDSLDIDSTKILCNYTSDSTLEVVKYYTNGRICYLWKYKFIIKHKIYILEKSLTLSNEITKKYNCDDTNKKFKQKFESDWEKTTTNDSTIIHIKEKSYRYREQLKDSIAKRIIYSDSILYYLDSQKRCIGVNDNIKIEYVGNDTLKYTRIFDDGFYSKTTQYQSLERKSEFHYLIKKTKIEKYSDLELIDKSFYELEYKLNKKSLPVKLEVLKSKNDYKRLGSIMTVKY